MTKAVILAGGLGTRIAEESSLRPKPMIEIGGRPILWHIMKNLSMGGINEFIICLGYKGYMIKEFFANYSLHMSDVTFSFIDGTTKTHRHQLEPWLVTLIDTGEESQTGGRLRRVREFVGEEPFIFTYGDGLSNVNFSELITFHNEHDQVITVTAVQPPGRYGSLEMDKHLVSAFVEKPDGDGGWINGGFFVVNPSVISEISNDDSSWENDVLPVMVRKQQVNAYKHEGFWMAMDTLRDKQRLEELWATRQSPWRTWS